MLSTLRDIVNNGTASDGLSNKLTRLITQEVLAQVVSNHTTNQILADKLKALSTLTALRETNLGKNGTLKGADKKRNILDLSKTADQLAPLVRVESELTGQLKAFAQRKANGEDISTAEADLAGKLRTLAAPRALRRAEIELADEIKELLVTALQEETVQKALTNAETELAKQLDTPIAKDALKALDDIKETVLAEMLVKQFNTEIAEQLGIPIAYSTMRGRNKKSTKELAQNLLKMWQDRVEDKEEWPSEKEVVAKHLYELGLLTELDLKTANLGHIYR